MIIEADKQHILPLAEMLCTMMIEVFGAKASTSITTYITYIEEIMANDRKWIFTNDKVQGLFVVIDDYETIIPDIHRYLATKVYIKPEYRNGRLLSDFYQKLYDTFDEVIGITEIDSLHIPVLEKRHERIANVYRIKKRR